MVASNVDKASWFIMCNVFNRTPLIFCFLKRPNEKYILILSQKKKMKSNENIVHQPRVKVVIHNFIFFFCSTKYHLLHSKNATSLLYQHYLLSNIATSALMFQIKSYVFNSFTVDLI
jgi:hypothetical protein